MLLAERIPNERLVQILEEMQRHRFGRPAETLPEDQVLLALEEAEQKGVIDRIGAASLCLWAKPKFEQPLAHLAGFAGVVQVVRRLSCADTRVSRLLLVALPGTGVAGAGPWATTCLHVAIDDATRLAYAGVLPDEKDSRPWGSLLMSFAESGCAASGSSG